MAKQLKDYIRMYGIGLQVRFDNKFWKIDQLKRDLVRLNRVTDYSKWVETYYSDVVPCLRKLSSMSEEERKELWQLVFNRAFNENGQTVFYAKPSLTSEPRWIMMSGVERLGIELNGHVWADSDLHHWKHNQHEVTHYLLSKGFDLFGLIDAGLAIDINSLNTQS